MSTLKKKLRKFLVGLSTFALVLVGVFAVDMPASAMTVQCSGWTACQTSPYTDHNWSTYYTGSYWGQAAGHNCTNYVAYYEQTINGQLSSRPSWLLSGNNADAWASEASSVGITVNNTPVVGAIAQWGDFTWNGNGGHVGIVESVSNGGGTIVVSEDSYSSGPFDWRQFNLGDVNTNSAMGWPQNFIHLGSTGVTSTSTQMFIRGDNALFAKNSIGNGGWTQETDPGVTSMISVGGNTQMLIATDASIWAKNSIGYGGWTQEVGPGNASKIAVSSTGVQMFIRGDNALFAKNSIGNGGWTQETDPNTATGVSVGGNTQLLLRGDGAVFAKNSIGVGGWTQETDPSTATTIAVSSTGVQLLIATDASIWAKNSIGYGGWTQEVGPGSATAIAVGADVQMFIRSDGAVFAKNSIGVGGWTQEADPGNAIAIAAG